MNQKKNKKILMILIIIVLIVILIAGAAIIYLVTDIFKTDKELFFKYVTQVGDNKKGFISQDLKEYFEKRNNTPYNNESKLSFSVPEEYYENTGIMDNFNITLSGQVDTANNKISQNISLNYSDSVNFPINFRKVENTMGLQTSYVGNKFISIDTDKLGNALGSQIAIDNYKDSLGKIEEVSNVELTEEQLNQIFNTYKSVLDNNLNDEDFSKVKDRRFRRV